MSKYVETDKIITAVKKGLADHIWNPEDSRVCCIEKRLKEIPPADVRENVHGEWVKRFEGTIAEGILFCNQCWRNTYRRTNFCPNCGADMRTKETDCDYERAIDQLEHDILYEPTFNQDDGSM